MNYRRPPITEATIELKFAREFDQEQLEAAAKGVKEFYFYEDPDPFQHLEINPQTGQLKINTWIGVKLSSIDRTELQLFRANAFVCSSLAPYPGWPNFNSRAKEGWKAWKKIAGVTELSRIAVRYINRIDIPNPEGRSIDPSNYLNLGVALPGDIGGPMASYAVQVVLPLGADDCRLVLNSSSMPFSPLIGFTSLLLDIDICREINLPKKDDAIWELLDRIRAHKNRVFEKCITDESRALFDQ
jgi:uncharacterized protein (TIGR04255 family)